MIDKEGIRTAEMQKRKPMFGLWNQFVHTIPLPYALMLITLVNYENISVQRIVCNCTAFIVGYLAWLSYCARQNGFWTYRVIQKQSSSQFIVFTGVCVMVLTKY